MLVLRPLLHPFFHDTAESGIKTLGYPQDRIAKKPWRSDDSCVCQIVVLRYNYVHNCVAAGLDGSAALTTGLSIQADQAG